MDSITSVPETTAIEVVTDVKFHDGKIFVGKKLLVFSDGLLVNKEYWDRMELAGGQ